MLYICIHNDTKIEYAEEYAYTTEDEKRWADDNHRRLITECFLRLPEIWESYRSTEKPFSFEVKKK